MKLNHIEALGLRILNAINRYADRKAPANVVTLDVTHGRIRAAAVAKYLSERAHELRLGWQLAADEGKETEAGAFQAGAASSEAMSNLILALLASDKEQFKAVLNDFVNDATDSGVVTV